MQSQPHPRPTGSESLGVGAHLAYCVLSGSPDENYLVQHFCKMLRKAFTAFTVYVHAATALRSPVEREPFSPSASFPQADLIIRHPLRDDRRATGRAFLSLEVDRGPASEF